MDMLQNADLGYYIFTLVSGLFTAGLGGFFGWFFTRKQYNSQVKNQDITNIDAAFETWQKIINSLETRVDKLLGDCEVLRGENTNLLKEISELKNEIMKLKTESKKIVRYEKKITELEEKVAEYEHLLSSNGIAY